MSYLQKEFTDAASGTITESKKLSGEYAPFIAPNKTTAELRQQTLEDLQVFLTNKALHAVSRAILPFSLSVFLCLSMLSWLSDTLFLALQYATFEIP